MISNLKSLKAQREPAPKSQSRLKELEERNANLDISVLCPSRQLCGILVAATSTWTLFHQRAILSLLSERNVAFPTVVNLSAVVAAALVIASILGSVSAATEKRLVGFLLI